MMSICLEILILIFSLSLSTYSFSSQWKNPKDIIGDPMIARLQQGRKELTPLEKEEIKKYGYTALEIMTYLYDNKHPGYHDNDEFHRCLNYIGGSISVAIGFTRRLYYYKDMKDKLTYNGLKPGKSIERKQIWLFTDPPKIRGTGLIYVFYTESEKVRRDKDQFSWVSSLRRIRRDVAPNKQDEYGNMIVTPDDDDVREPWEEEHRILGMDRIRGKECFVIESKHRLIKNYYLSKRVTWVEKENFLELHQEQFDRKGRLYKIFDTDWYRVKPGNHWVPRQTNVVKLPKHERTVHQTPAWIVDQGLTEEDLSYRVLERERPWREVDIQLKPIRRLSDFPPEPKIRWEFWNKIGIKPVVKE